MIMGLKGGTGNGIEVNATKESSLTTVEKTSGVVSTADPANTSVAQEERRAFQESLGCNGGLWCRRENN